ncbi:AbrB family transcriptional regulator [Nitrincola sp. MINF-07-Sa-05]|uniref:AbrB family transcriptional regulator n=1 Tax=Nitrincola salilacus TaxID=3400273 RepID=UPI0039181FC4
MKTIYTLLIGAAGGLVAWWCNLPLPWMLGPLLLITLLALCGTPTAVNKSLNRLCLGVLGFWLGSGFDPTLLSESLKWYPSLVLMVLSVSMTIVLNSLIFRKLAGLDLITSIFSSLPGTMNAVVIQGDQLGGDARWIAIAQTLRIAMVVIITSMIFHFIPGTELEGPDPASGQLSAVPLLLLVPLGWWVARQIRLPMAEFLGPLICSVLLSLSGHEIQLPGWIMIVTFIVLGSSIGCRFQGTCLKQLLKVSRYAALATVLAMIIASLFAGLTSMLTGIPLSHTFLALVPGGVGEMALIATAAGIDPLYVVLIHLIRMFLLIMLTPLLCRLLSARQREVN